jgi:hypothetical protein
MYDVLFANAQREVTVNSIPFSVLARIGDGVRADKEDDAEDNGMESD